MTILKHLAVVTLILGVLTRCTLFESHDHLGWVDEAQISAVDNFLYPAHYIGWTGTSREERAELAARKDAVYRICAEKSNPNQTNNSDALFELPELNGPRPVDPVRDCVIEIESGETATAVQARFDQVFRDCVQENDPDALAALSDGGIFHAERYPFRGGQDASNRTTKVRDCVAHQGFKYVYWSAFGL